MAQAEVRPSSDQLFTQPGLTCRRATPLCGEQLRTFPLRCHDDEPEESRRRAVSGRPLSDVRLRRLIPCRNEKRINCLGGRWRPTSTRVARARQLNHKRINLAGESVESVRKARLYIRNDTEGIFDLMHRILGRHAMKDGPAPRFSSRTKKTWLMRNALTEANCESRGIATTHSRVHLCDVCGAFK